MSGDIEVPYLAGWQAVELIAADHGEAALRRLVTAGASTGSDADAEAATDDALASVLGTTRTELTEAWLTRLGRLAHEPRLTLGSREVRSTSRSQDRVRP